MGYKASAIVEAFHFITLLFIKLSQLSPKETSTKFTLKKSGALLL
jgi:hypothetical protein